MGNREWREKGCIRWRKVGCEMIRYRWWGERSNCKEWDRKGLKDEGNEKKGRKWDGNWNKRR